MPNDSRKKLYDGLKSKNLYTKSYEDFNSQFANPDSRQKLYEGIKSKNLYTKSYDDFNNQFFSDVKKKDQPQTTSTGGGVVQTPPQPSQPSLTASEVWSQASSQAPQTTAPTPTDVASESAGLDVQSPSGVPSPNVADIVIPDIERAESIPAYQGELTQPKVDIPAPTSGGMTYQEATTESTIPTANALNIQAERMQMANNKAMMELDMEKETFNDIMNEVRSKYTPEQIAKGEYLDFAREEFRKRAKGVDFTNLEGEGYQALNYLEQKLLEPQNQLQKDLSNVSIRKSLSSNPDLFDQSVMSPTEMAGEVVREDLANKYGTDVTAGEALFLDQDDFNMRNIIPSEYDEISGDYWGTDFVNNAREVYLEDTANKKQKDLLLKGSSIFRYSDEPFDPQKSQEDASDFYKEVMTQKVKAYMSPWNNDIYDKINELEDLLTKQRKGKDIDKKKLVSLYTEIQNLQGGEGKQVYDPITGQYHIQNAPTLGLESQAWGQEVDEFKKQYSDLGISKMRQELDKEVLKQEERQRILDKYKSKGVPMLEYAPITEEYQNGLKKIQALSDLVAFNYDPSKSGNRAEGLKGFATGVGKGVYQGITGKDYKGDYEDDVYRLNLLREAGMPLNKEIEKYMTPDDWEDTGKSVGGSLVAGGKIGIELALGNKLKGVMGIPKIIERLAGGNGLKKRILDGAFDANMYGTSYELAGESYATGLGEYGGERLGGRLAKNIKLNPDGLTSLLVEWGSGNLTEMGAELSGELVDRIAKGENVDEALVGTLGLDTKEGLSGKLKELALHTMILSGGAMSTKTYGVVKNKIKNLRNKPNKTQEEVEELEILEDNIDETKAKEVENQILNDEELAQEYSEIKDKPEAELTAEEKLTKQNVEGVIEDMPAEQLAETKIGEQLEIEFPEDKLQAQRDKIADIEGQTKTKEDAVQEQSTESVDVREQPTDGEGVGVEDTKGEEITQESKEVQEEVTEPQDGDTISQPARFEGGLEKNYRYNAENGTWNEIDSQGNELGGEISPTLSEKLTQDFINQKQEQYESKRVDADKASYGSSKQTVPSEERLRMEQKDDKTVGDEQATEPSGRGVTSQEQENVTGESVTKETEGQELKSPPPAKETGESSVEEKKIKEASKSLAKAIRSKKFVQDMSDLESLRNDPTGLFKGAWDGGLEILAKSIEAGGTVAQAVSDAVNNIKESDWYKGLSEEGKAKAEGILNDKLNERISEAEKQSVKKPTPKKEGTKTERRKQFLNRAKKDTTIDDRTKRFLAEADEMYEVESNQWANADADRLIEAYEREGATDELFDDIKSKENMSESVQAMLALKLARKLQSEGKFEQANEVYQWIDETARGSGRFIQALREQASPDGVMRAKEAQWMEDKSQAMSDKTASKQNTNEEVTNDARKGAETAVENFTNNIDENTEINKAVKNVADKAVKKRETSKSRARKNITKEKAYRKKLRDQFKGNKGEYLSSAPTGLTSQGIEYAGNIAASYIRQGVYNLAELIENVKSFFKEELDYEITPTDERKISEQIVANEKIIKQGLKEMDTNIKDIVKNHFKNKEEYGKRLADKLVEEAGLNEVEAKYLEDQVMKSFNDAVKSTMEAELTRMFNRAKNNGTPKRVKTFTERVIDAYRYGALDGNKFADQFGEYFGFTSLTQEDRVEISKLAGALETAPEGSHIQRKIMGEFANHLDNLDKKGFKYKVREMAQMAMEFWYTSILSGMTTLYRGAKGIIQTTSADLFVEALKNPRLFFSAKGFSGGANALLQGFKKGKVAFKEIMKSGYNAMDTAKSLELTPSKMNEFINKKQKGIPKNIAKVMYYLPTKMVRALIASDALLKLAAKDLFAYTKNYNNILTEGMDRKSKEFWDEMQTRMANTKAEYDIALETAKGEKKTMQEAGVDTKGFNEKLRAYEILEEKRDASVNEYSSQKAEQAGLNQTPQGTVGLLYEAITKFSKWFPPAKLIVPFTRIPSNAMNMWLDWSPIGFKRAAFGYGTFSSFSAVEKAMGEKKFKEMGMGSKSMTADQRMELMIKATIGTATWGLLFWQLGLDEDDENKFIDLSYNGYGDYKENESLRKQGWRPYSMRMKIGGEWSDWIEYRDAPMGFVFSSLSSVNDELKYAKDDKDKLTKSDTQDLILHGLGHSMLFVKEQNYMQGVSKLMKSFEGKGFGTKLAKYGVDTPTDFVKSILFPNTYKQSYGTYKALTGKPQNIKTRFNEGILKYTFQRMVSDVPFLEDMESANEGEMFDVLGYPIVRKVRDVNPILSLIYAEDFDTQMRDSKQYENHKLLIDRGLKVTFYWPKKDGDRDLTSLEKARISKDVATSMNDFITDNYSKLKSMEKDKAQELLDKRKSKFQKRARKKYLK